MNMKNGVIKISVLILAVVLVIGLASCELPFINSGSSSNNGGINGGADGDANVGSDSGSTDSNLEGLVLIENKAAKFQLVYTSDAGSAGFKKAQEFVKQLRGFGIAIDDPVRENDRDAVKACEIIIGSGAKLRGEELSITQKELGENGLIVKIVGQRILIAGGTADLTVSLFENYIEEEMKITKKTETINSLAVNDEYTYERKTDYDIDTITFAGVDLSEYTFIYDTAGLVGFNTGALEAFRTELYDLSGYWLDKGTIENIDTYEHCFIFRYTEDAGEKGFRIYFDEGDFIVECSYKNAFEPTFDTYVNTLFRNKANTNINLKQDYLKEYDVTKAYYKDFGAKGDGVTDDFAALLATHDYANQGGQTVCGTYGATYYINPKSFTKAIPVFTDVDLCGATIIVDDRGDDAFAHRGKALFSLASDNPVKKITVKDVATEAIEIDGVKISVPSGTTELSWIVPYLEADVSMVRLRNAAHKDYVRFGSNQNVGQARHEMIVVNKDGTITEDTTVFFDYDKLTDVYIWRGDDKPITIENGEFYNICCQAALVNDPKYGGVTAYQAFARGIKISRANVTIKNLNHKMVDQPIVLSNEDDANGSYPYGGFLSISGTYNLLVEDCVLAGHTTYYERKSATESAGGVGGEDNFVAAGSYDFVFGDSTHITFNNVDQQNIDYTIDDETHVITAENGGYDNGIGDNRYWGIMCSNFVKNLKFRDCEISRIDAHEGFFNVEVVDCVIGHTFNAVGGGDLYVENMVRITGDCYIVTRGDYGGSFKGTMTIKNGELKGYSAYNSSVWYQGNKALNTSNTYGRGYVLNTGYNEVNDGANLYFEWDFGYDCYMPEKITFIGSFETGVSELFVSYRDYHDYYTKHVPDIKAKNPDYHAYELIKIIEYKDWDGKQIEINRHANQVGNENDYMAKNIQIIIE